MQLRVFDIRIALDYCVAFKKFRLVGVAGILINGIVHCIFLTGIVLAAVAIMLFHGHTFLMAYKIGMISRIIMTGAVYQKVLWLNQVVVGRISIGHIVNLASNDVQRFDLVCKIKQLLGSATTNNNNNNNNNKQNKNADSGVCIWRLMRLVWFGGKYYCNPLHYRQVYIKA